ncbi:MAG: primosomal protein N' [Rhodobacteraceae bacterium]|nr:primosomal protein N' [Paracoccaceae bacterium]
MFFDEGMQVGVRIAAPPGCLLDYRAPQGGCAAGAFVQVPLGARQVLGVVWGAGQGAVAPSKLRPVERVLDLPPMRAEMQDFLTQAAHYTLTPLFAMMRLAMPAFALAESAATHKRYGLGPPCAQRRTAARQRVLQVLEEAADSGVTLGELCRRAQVSPAVVRGLVRAGAVLPHETPRDAPFPPLDPQHSCVELTPAQAAAAQQLRESLRGAGYGTTLLRGVTGSGKTEVYLEAVAECLRQGRQALVLLPEIVLSVQFIDRVRARFGAPPAEWHSAIATAERRRIWKKAGTGAVQMVIGARSALFLPFQNLGLIVVDEEHDTSYKQEDGVLYHARDMAVLRASLCGARVVLASATPSLETWVNAQSGKYQRLELPERFGAAVLPAIRAIDMRAQALPPGRWISEELAAAVRTRLHRGEQSLLFLNRRGYAPVRLCRACGHQLGCRQCDARMVEHRALGCLLCHRCGARTAIADACPACGVEGRLTAVGPGVERLADEAKTLFVGARRAVLSSDAFESTPDMKATLARISQGRVDLVIGTQLVAKGHHFPRLTLVGVIDADLGLQGADLRAAERSFQLMQQVAGRAGRAGGGGLALLQTWQPQHGLIRAIVAQDAEAFWRAQAAERKQAHMPPYGRLAGVILSAPKAQHALDLGQALAQRDAPLRRIGARVYGPAPAPIARLRGRHRVRLLVVASKKAPLQGALAQWVGQFRLQKGVRLAVDIDPQSFY